MKTPLASIRLQAEFLANTLTEDRSGRERATKRLIASCDKLENLMDKILQLGRIEGGGNLNLVPINLAQFVTDSHQRWANDLELKIDIPENDRYVSADELALGLILRNLFENTKNHAPHKKAVVTIKNFS